MVVTYGYELEGWRGKKSRAKSVFYAGNFHVTRILAVYRIGPLARLVSI